MKPFEPVKRKSRSRKERAALFQLRDGICFYCVGTIGANEKWDWVHKIPLAMGGEDTIENSFCGHAKCHRGTNSPTSQDQAEIAEAKRKEAKRFNFIVPKQSIKSAGFPKAVKPKNRAILPELPRRYFGVIIGE